MFRTTPSHMFSCQKPIKFSQISTHISDCKCTAANIAWEWHNSNPNNDAYLSRNYQPLDKSFKTCQNRNESSLRKNKFSTGIELLTLFTWILVTLKYFVTTRAGQNRVAYPNDSKESRASSITAYRIFSWHHKSFNDFKFVPFENTK